MASSTETKSRAAHRGRNVVQIGARDATLALRDSDKVEVLEPAFHRMALGFDHIFFKRQVNEGDYFKNGLISEDLMRITLVDDGIDRVYHEVFGIIIKIIPHDLNQIIVYKKGQYHTSFCSGDDEFNVKILKHGSNLAVLIWRESTLKSDIYARESGTSSYPAEKFGMEFGILQEAFAKIEMPDEAREKLLRDTLRAVTVARAISGFPKYLDRSPDEDAISFYQRVWSDPIQRGVVFREDIEAYDPSLIDGVLNRCKWIAKDRAEMPTAFYPPNFPPPRRPADDPPSVAKRKASNRRRQNELNRRKSAPQPT